MRTPAICVAEVILCLLALAVHNARAQDKSAQGPSTPAQDVATPPTDDAAKATAPAPAPLPTPQSLIRQAVAQLIAMEEEDGQWPYEGVYRVNREIPIGYRVGGTAILGGTLLHAAAPDDAAAAAAIDRAAAFVLTGLDHPLMRPSTQDAYDVRIWGQAYALEYLCMLRAAKRTGKQEEAIAKWIPRLIEILIEQEIPGGGWNYANHRSHATFVTAPVMQALLLARSQGENVPTDVLSRGKDALVKSRTADGAFVYSGVARGGSRPNARSQMPGAIARSPICETTLALCGAGSIDSIRTSIEAFHTHWDELENRRQKTGTHEGPYQVAPYYFYYGHRYVAQAIEMLPADERPAQRERLLRVIMKTRGDDGTWNDRVFPRSKNYGTAMIVLALLGEKTPRPPAAEL